MERNEIILQIENIYKSTPLDIDSSDFAENLKYKLNKILPDELKNDKKSIKALIIDIKEYNIDNYKTSKIDENTCLKAILETSLNLLKSDNLFRIDMIKTLENHNSNLSDDLFKNIEDQSKFIYNFLEIETIDSKKTDMFRILKILKNMDIETVNIIKNDLSNNEKSWTDLLKKIIETTKNEYINEILNEKLGENLFKKIETNKINFQKKARASLKSLDIEPDMYDL